MKKLFQIAFFSALFCTNICAQQILPENQTFSQQIYFDNAVYQLNTTQRATLDKLATEIANKEILMINIVGTADQKGKQKNNEILAKQRAEQVKNYLLRKGVPPTLVKIDKCEILPVGINQNNRHANITVQYAAPIKKDISTKIKPAVNPTTNINLEEQVALQSLEDFFAYAAKKQEQQFSISVRKAKVLTGKKGTVIHIPPNAFETLDGKDVLDEVHIHLHEAHTYSDMILQNLVTISGDTQLETGGMIRITATDANGQTLQLKKGKELFVSLPNENANSANMLVFMGERDPHENMNWQTDSLSVVVASGVASPFAKKTNYDIQSEVFQSLLRINNNAAILEKPLPKPVNPPAVFNKQAPKRPVFTSVDEPQLSDYYDNFAQNTKATFAQYSVKARKKYSEDHSVYAQKKENQEKIYQTYRRDSLNYAKNLAQHQKEVDKHQQYIAELRLSLQKANDVEKSIDLKKYSQQLTMLSQTIANITNTRIFDTKAQFLLAQLQELKGKHPAFEDISNKLDTVYCDEKKFKGLHTFSEELNVVLKNVQQQAYTEELQRLNQIDAEKYFAESPTYNISRLLEKEDWTKQDCNDAIKWINIVRQKYNNNFSKIQAKYSQFMKKNSDVIMLCHQKHETIYNDNMAIFNKKCELGLLSANEIAETFKNVLTINTLGWINCDKFSTVLAKRNTINISIDPGKQENTQFFIVFDNIKSIMPAMPFSETVYRTIGLPETEKVTIIGLRIENQQAEMSISKGTVGELRQVRANFTPKTLDEVYAFLSTLS